MECKKILFITQEIIPYVSESVPSKHGRKLPAVFQESGKEIRTFMPRWGMINERRNQLHEVIRLSGMNIIIDATDHPLIIKVASIQAARMQVYFIDNDDYFHKRLMFADDKGTPYADNLERAVFYARGVLETVKKLRWSPDIIFCQGWIAAVAPFYIKTAYHEDPPFVNTKVVSSFYNDLPLIQDAERAKELICFRNANAKTLKEAGIDLADPMALGKMAVRFSDAVVEGESGAQPELLQFADSLNLPVLHTPDDEQFGEAYKNFFDQAFK